MSDLSELPWSTIKGLTPHHLNKSCHERDRRDPSYLAVATGSMRVAPAATQGLTRALTSLGAPRWCLSGPLDFLISAFLLKWLLTRYGFH